MSLVLKKNTHGAVTRLLDSVSILGRFDPHSPPSPDPESATPSLFASLTSKMRAASDTLCVFTGDHQEGPGEPRLWLQRVRRAPGEGRLRQHDPAARPRPAGRPQALRSHPAGTCIRLQTASVAPVLIPGRSEQAGGGLLVVSMAGEDLPFFNSRSSAFFRPRAPKVMAS